MCGIVGYTGPQDAVRPVLEGLSRLEYRGYDSAGICVSQDQELKTYKKEGKLTNLKNFLHTQEAFGQTAIGHTRWATHGAVNDINAHPHQSKNVAIVHNGIIENSNEIKAKLKARGRDFLSETDTEAFLALLEDELTKESDRVKAIGKTFSQIKGNSAFVILFKDSPDLYAVKRSAPLVCGENQETEELLVSSDPYALVGFAEKLYFPENEVICHLKYSLDDPSILFYELGGEPSDRYRLKKQDRDLEVSHKGNFEHFMLKEIYEQPSLIRTLVQYYQDKSKEGPLTNIKRDQLGHVYIIGCGTAWHAGLLIKSFIEKFASLRTSAELASEFRYRSPLLSSNDLAIFVSQSGETADTLACQEMCKEQGVKTVSIVNVEGSTLFRDCDENFLIKAGIEIGVASTKAFTLQVLTGFIFAKALAEELDFSSLLKETNLLVIRLDQVLSSVEHIKSVAQKIYQKKGYLFTGRIDYFPIALEGALKLKEIAYVHAEGYASGELKHGPIALIDEAIVNIAIVAPELYEKTVANVEEVKARNGKIIIVGPEGDKELATLADHFFGVNFSELSHLAPLLVNSYMQLLSYYIANLKGTDIDKPRNLAKSVTVE